MQQQSIESTKLPIQTPIAPSKTPLKSLAQTPMTPFKTPIKTPMIPFKTPIKTPAQTSDASNNSSNIDAAVIAGATIGAITVCVVPPCILCLGLVILDIKVNDSKAIGAITQKINRFLRRSGKREMSEKQVLELVVKHKENADAVLKKMTSTSQHEPESEESLSTLPLPERKADKTVIQIEP
ncbi:hypothetical protein D5018_20660 [Parashewanella curva]|uniref:Uncharacterized protein n=1 Tax=Parashewanella curva TaxID=2338552 RepID=A0A3L8PQY6_9GAMM|nr:hypothetical protein [Parashewanella curva]RLV57790.1 hypothetical protein D5018_20660 [Parashewanella curva]